MKRYDVRGSESSRPESIAYALSLPTMVVVSAIATLFVEGRKVSEKRFPKTLPNRMSLDETLDIGEDTGTPLSEDYKVPFKFTGKLDKVTIELKPAVGGRAPR